MRRASGAVEASEMMGHDDGGKAFMETLEAYTAAANGERDDDFGKTVFPAKTFTADETLCESRSICRIKRSRRYGAKRTRERAGLLMRGFDKPRALRSTGAYRVVAMSDMIRSICAQSRNTKHHLYIWYSLFTLPGRCPYPTLTPACLRILDEK